MTPFRSLWKFDAAARAKNSSAGPIPTPSSNVDSEREACPDPIRIHQEIYDSDAMLEAHEEINALPRGPTDDLERVVAPLMVWSDSTHLASFGDASLWPFYLYFGNQSKYTRAKPTADACHHLAYIPTVCDGDIYNNYTLIIPLQLPDAFQDWYHDQYGRSAADCVLTPSGKTPHFLRSYKFS